MSIAADIVGPLAWSLAGFIIGFLLARLTHDVHEIKEVAMSSDTTEQPRDDDGSPGGQGGPGGVGGVGGEATGGGTGGQGGVGGTGGVGGEGGSGSQKSPPVSGYRLVGSLVILLSILSVTLLAISNDQQRAIVDCQSDVNRRMVETINARAAAAAKDKAALDGMLAAVLTLKTSEERRAAVADYVEVARQTAEERQNTPYPTPAEFDCKEAR